MSAQSTKKNETKSLKWYIAASLENFDESIFFVGGTSSIIWFEI